MTKFKQFISTLNNILDLTIQPVLAGFTAYAALYLYNLAKNDSNHLLYLVGFSCLFAAITLFDRFINKLIETLMPLINKLAEKRRR